MQSRRQKENQYLGLEAEGLFQEVVIDFQDPQLVEGEVIIEKEDMTKADLEEDITLHIMPSTGGILTTNKCLTGTLPEGLVREDEVARGVEEGLDPMKNIFETHDMPMTSPMVGLVYPSSITQEATKIEIIILTIRGEALNQVTLITTDV